MMWKSKLDKFLERHWMVKNVKDSSMKNHKLLRILKALCSQYFPPYWFPKTCHYIKDVAIVLPFPVRGC